MNTKIYLLVLLVFVVIDVTKAQKCKGTKKKVCAQLNICKEEKDKQAMEIDELKAENAEQAKRIEELEKECKCYKSCKEAYDDGHMEDKAYTLCLDSGREQVFCQMSDVAGCGSGGFTLVMKINGAEQTMLYDSDLWTNKEVCNPGAGMTGLDNQETKLSTYWESPFSKVCLGMKVGDDLRFISIDQEASSLYSLIADGQFRPTFLGRDTWKSLIADSSLQLNCNNEGFNAQGDSPDDAKARIGISSNQEDNCLSNDSRIGFGTGGRMDPQASCGNSAGWDPDNGDKDIKAFGYIFVQ